MKKNKVLDFINLLKSSNNLNLDQVTQINLKEMNDIINLMDQYDITNLKYIVKKSIPIFEKLASNYHNFDNKYFNLVSKDNVDYKKIRKELHNYPSYDENKAFDFKNKINTIKSKFHYLLKINNININVIFYTNEESDLFESLLKIIYIFIKTFGIDMDNNVNIYNNYNLRLLLVDFPRQLDVKNSENTDQFEDLSKKGYFNNSSGVHISSRKELVVTRKTGITGLLIHELIHMLGLDFCFNFESMKHVNLMNWEKEWVNNNNIIESNHNIYSFIESVCNTNSSYFLAIYNAIALADKANDSSYIELITKYFKYFYYIETIYSYLMAVKVLNYFNFDTYDSFFNNNSNRKYYQNAYVFEYVIMRMILLSDFYKMILKSMIENNYNKKNTSKSNYDFQENLNKKMLTSVSKKTLKNIFDEISMKLKIIQFNKYIEYFCITV
jgi:hypothetical protein